MKAVILAAVAALSLSSLPSFAQEWYLGGGVGRGNLNQSGTDLGLPNAQVGDSATTYTVRTGFRFTPFTALELSYYDMGEYDFSSDVGNVKVAGTAKAKTFALSTVAFAPLGPHADLYGRLGYGISELKANASAGGFVANDKDKERGLIYGVGARWNVSRSWGIFAEWVKADKIKVDSYLAGIDLRF